MNKFDSLRKELNTARENRAMWIREASRCFRNGDTEGMKVANSHKIVANGEVIRLRKLIDNVMSVGSLNRRKVRRAS